MNPPEKFTLYQVIVRLFGNKNTTNKPFGTIEENGSGKFNDFDDTALKAIKDLGFSHIWYTGVIEHALLTDYSHYGVVRDSAQVVKGRAGSPYAIKDYFDVNPDLAEDVPNRMAEFESLVKRTQAYSMKVIIDFIPNHVSRNYHSDCKPEHLKDLGEGDNPDVTFSPQNDFYYFPGETFTPPKESLLPAFADDYLPHHEFPARATGNDHFTASPSIYDWYETVKLNYGVDYQHSKKHHFDPIPGLWKKMKNILLFWAAKGIDGFRCDMVELVPVAFWEWVIPKIKSEYPDLIFIAEVYDPSRYNEYLYKGGFDYLYDKVGLYDVIRDIIERNAPTGKITGCMHDLGDDMNDRMLRFLENHDEHRFASEEYVNDPWMGVPAMTVLATVHKGPLMVYFGQEVGEPARGKEGYSDDDGKTTIFDYWGVPEHQKWMNGGAFDGWLLSEKQRELLAIYRKLLHLNLENPALKKGDFYSLQPENEKNHTYDEHKLYSFLRYTVSERLLVVVNFDAKVSKIARLLIPERPLQLIGFSLETKFEGTDLLRGRKQIASDGQQAAKHGIEITLPPKGAFVFPLQPLTS